MFFMFMLCKNTSGPSDSDLCSYVKYYSFHFAYYFLITAWFLVDYLLMFCTCVHLSLDQMGQKGGIEGDSGAL